MSEWFVAREFNEAFQRLFDEIRTATNHDESVHPWRVFTAGDEIRPLDLIANINGAAQALADHRRRNP